MLRRWSTIGAAVMVASAACAQPDAPPEPSPPPEASPPETSPPESTPPEPSPASAEETKAPADGATRRRRTSQQSPTLSTPDASTAEGAANAGAPEIPPVVPVIPSDTLGFSGKSPWGERPLVNVIPRSTIAIPDRWRIGWPRWDRYGRQAPSDPILQNISGGDIPYTLGNPINPHDRSVLKGDYPLFAGAPGEDIFLNVTGVSDTLILGKKLPTPSGVSAAAPGSFDFFGAGESLTVKTTALLSFDLFQGNTAFRPVDWLVRVTPAFDYNQVWLRENNNVDADVRSGEERGDSHVFLQETFLEVHLGDLSHWFDFAAAKVGRQLFVSDFRGFVFNDVSDGVRLFGTGEANRVQWNLAFFNQVEKDTNSEFNTLDWRDQQVLIANLYCQDFIFPGYTAQVSYHWNHDQSDEKYDNNGFLVRPSLIGDVTLQDIDAHYLGWAGDGHIGRLNVNHAFYYAFGRDRANPLAGRNVDISAFLGAIELSVDVDWLRPKASFVFASGDSDPEDGTGGGFDGIFDNPSFIGGPGSFFQGNGLRLFGVNLKSGRSLYNDLTGAKTQGFSNFVNPGTIIGNVGLDAEITPRVRASLNASTIWFADTSSLDLFLAQDGIDQHFGEEVNLTVQWRPLLSNNIIVTGGASAFVPGQGFTDMFEDDGLLFQAFLGLTFVY